MRPESKKLREYIKTLEDAGLLVKAAFGEAGAGLADSGVNYFSYDSRDVEPGTLFLCKGAGFREEYLKAAAEAGASVCVAE
ncbi:MAG: UDP-N-acetylmuramoyl-L-alanyl-D-glutamate--2,6-diaminopimelate ligase, partial [Firmicutes bacterium]|nr:UDP-N-acetylmuramoyl-L-alanyl-D-glutamate--2,6-diaminopimelate ligase [Bacillota bacterium]